ncbi:PD-(D/E)XK nuclease family protein [Patescibacteria group bacterium]|nr:PD-(D/E)XK nuclease family protein [Patescibacteria group bacterium]
MPRADTFTSWSNSRLRDYLLCPFKAKLKHLLKLKEPQNDAMSRGDRIHKLAEAWIRGQIDGDLPEELSKFPDLFAYLRARFAKRSIMTVVEDSWAYTKDWQPTTWDDWTGAWLRIKIDAAWEPEDDPGVLVVNDWKTGKFRDSEAVEYEEQLSLYALGALLQPAYTHIHTVRAMLSYLDLGLTYPSKPADVKRLVFKRSDLPKLKKAWERRVTPMFADRTFDPTPNRYCGWCHFRKANGGPCRY